LRRGFVCDGAARAWETTLGKEPNSKLRWSPLGLLKATPAELVEACASSGGDPFGRSHAPA